MPLRRILCLPILKQNLYSYFLKLNCHCKYNIFPPYRKTNQRFNTKYLHIPNIIIKFATKIIINLQIMITTIFGCWILAIITVALLKCLDKLGNSSCPATVASEPLFDTFDENFDEPIRLASPNNTATEIVKRGRFFCVTIANSITGDKQTLRNTNKKYLVWDANNLAYEFFKKEQEITK